MVASRQAGQVAQSAFLTRWHPGDVIVAAVVLDSDDFADVHERRIEVALRVNRESLRRIRELGHHPGFELSFGGSRLGQSFARARAPAQGAGQGQHELRKAGFAGLRGN
jgi:hypothetical protein